MNQTPSIELQFCGEKKWSNVKPLEGKHEFKWVSGVATDSKNNFCIIGFLTDEKDKNGNGTAYVGKYQSDGKKIWFHELKCPNPEKDKSYEFTLHGIAADSEDNVYITGSIIYNDNDNETDVFAARYSSDKGEQENFWECGTKAFDRGRGIAIDSNGNVYVTGVTFGDLKEASHKGEGDIFLAMCPKSSGEMDVIDQIGTENFDQGVAITLDSDDNIYISGDTGGKLQVDEHKGEEDFFIVKYSMSNGEFKRDTFDSQGTDESNAGSVKTTDGKGDQYEWLWQEGTVVMDNSRGIVVDNDGNVYITGETRGYFNDKGGTESKGTKAYFAMYSNKEFKWAKNLYIYDQKKWAQTGKPVSTQGKKITADIGGNVYLVGEILIDKVLEEIFLAEYKKKDSKLEYITLDASWWDRSETIALSLDRKGNVYGVGVAKHDIEICGYKLKKGAAFLATGYK